MPDPEGAPTPLKGRALRTQPVDAEAPQPEPETGPPRSVQVSLAGLVDKRWVLALPAILLAIAGGVVIEQARSITPPGQGVTPPLSGWLLLAAAAILLAAAAWPIPKLSPAATLPFVDTVRAMRRKPLFVVPLALAVLCGAIAVPLFWMLNAGSDSSDIAGNWAANTASWLFFIASLLFFGIAFVVWERTVRGPEERVWHASPADMLPRGLEWLALIAIFGLALLLRLPNLDAAPPGLWFDEVYHGYIARGLLEPDAVHRTFFPEIVKFGALYFYLLGLVLKVTGHVIWALRLLPALSGALIAPLLYLLAARLYGWRTGLAAGVLVAVSAWNLTFSRFGMVGMFTALLDVAVYLCMAQALRTGRLGYYAAGGVLMGLAFQTYYTARLVPLVLIVLLAHLFITERLRLVRALRTGAVIFVVGALLASLPVLLFALQHPDQFNSRLDTVSVFSPQNSGGDPLGALGGNLNKHLLMFNWEGDANARHNLPWSPMLDWLAASLFFAGLGSCLLRAWRWQYLFPLLWFAVTLSGGVLSMPSEAPQSHRTLENSITTALLASIFLGDVWRLLTPVSLVARLVKPLSAGTRRPMRSGALTLPVKAAWAAGAAGVLLFAGWAGVLDFHRYFQVQAASPNVWNMMDGEKVYAARTALRYSEGNNYDVYVSPSIKSTHAFQYLTPDLVTLDWPGAQALPLSNSKPDGAVVILDPPSAADIASLARMYPHASFEIGGAPGISPLLYIAKIPASDISQLLGVRATFYDRNSEKPQVDKILPDFTVDWKNAGIQSGAARLASTLKVGEYGSYALEWRSSLNSPGAVEMLVDGYRVASRQAITLAAGLHTVVVTETVQSAAGASGASGLYWATGGKPQESVPADRLFDPQKVEPHGLTGLYRAGTDPVGAPQLAHVDPVVSFLFQVTPLQRPYNVEWLGRLYVPVTGSYTFGTIQLSISQLFLDDRAVVTNNTINTLVEGTQDLTAGWHKIRVLFQDLDNYSDMNLYWSPPGRTRSIIPSAFLWPMLGEYPDIAQARGLPTLADTDGTQLPPDRVAYVPAREGEGQPQAQPQPGSQATSPGGSQPAGTATPPPPAQGQVNQPGATESKVLEPLLLLGEGGHIGGIPRAVAADKSGSIYIFTENDSKIHKYAPNGKESASWDVKEASGAPLNETSAIAVEGDTLYLLEAVSAVDHPQSNLVSYTLGGKLMGRVPLGRLHFARGLALAGDGNFWVANTGYHIVHKFSPGGEQLKLLGEKGAAAGQFDEPASVSEAPDGTLFVGDIGNKRVQSFTPDLKPLAQWTVGGSIAREGNRVAATPQGDVIVTESAGRFLVMYDRMGKELKRWVYIRDGKMLTPSGIASLGGDRFVVLFPDDSTAALFSISGK